MAKIIVRHHGQEIASLQLEDGHEYLAGRAEDAALILPNQKGISRHHLKFYQRDGVWIVELLARYGTLMFSGHTQEVIELKENCGFSAPPFEFLFHSSPAQTDPHKTPREEADAADHTSRLPAVRSQRPTPLTTTPSFQTGHEATAAGVSSVTPFLRIFTKATQKEEVLRLEGHLWVAGRDASCEIPLDESRASRRHFELSRTSEGFFITDLDSANGTYLNEERLPANEPWQLASGDNIRVAEVKVIFEVRDLSFSARLPAPVSTPEPEPRMDLVGSLPAPYLESGYPNVVKVDTSPGRRSRAKSKPNLVRWITLALIPILLYKFFSSPSPPSPPVDQAESSSTSPTFDQLSSEKKRAVKDSFSLAKTMYMQGKYTLCLAELAKLHQIVPAFDNSTELQVFCKQGHDLTLKQQDNDRKERERAETARQITQVVEDCRRQMTPTTTLDQIRECLAPAIERDPEHPLVLDLQQSIQLQQSERDRQRQVRDSEKQRMATGQRQFEKAKSLYRSGQLAKALNEYEKFINGGYRELDSERAEAQRDIAQVRKELGQKVGALVQSCKEQLEKSQFKGAYQACEQATKEDPTNADAKRLRAQVLSEVKREMKSMYEDSVLEESMGNIETAKDRWKQIIDKSVPGDEYYNKAKRNLQKYGVGM